MPTKRLSSEGEMEVSRVALEELVVNMLESDYGMNQFTARIPRVEP